MPNTFSDAIGTYSYFTASLVGFLIVLLAFARFKTMRRTMFISGLALVPLSGFSILHEEAYWSPRRVLGGSFGIEDVLFCFSVGSLVWCAGVRLLHHRILIAESSRVFFSRATFLLTEAILLFLVMQRRAHSIVVASVAVHLTVMGTAIYLRRKVWTIALCAMIGYTAYYLAFLCAASWFIPHFFSIWNGYALSGIRCFGMPIEEGIWIATFGGMWSAAMAYALDAKPGQAHGKDHAA